MGKGKLILLVAFVMVLSLATWVYKINVNSKLTSEEKSKIILLVNSYYNNMMDKDYKGALDLVDITKSDYEKDLEILNSRKGYVVQQRLDGNHWIVPNNGSYDYTFYDKQSNCFIVETGANIIYKDNIYQSTEAVSIKRVGKNFKIVRIITDDKFGYIRGSYITR